MEKLAFVLFPHTERPEVGYRAAPPELQGPSAGRVPHRRPVTSPKTIEATRSNRPKDGARQAWIWSGDSSSIRSTVSS